jgi:WNK lysine deficient protein kinase
VILIEMLRDGPTRRGNGKDRNLDPALTDPTLRFVRHDDYVQVLPGLVRYFACDHQTGLEVSWHELIFERWPSSEEWPALQAHFDRLKQLKHDYLFSVQHYWLNADAKRVIFITDAVPAKSIVEDFLRDNSTVRRKVIARWFGAILEVLRYLHSLSPPIVHGRIQPSSVFVRGPSIKIDIPYFIPPIDGGFTISPFTPPETISGEECPASDIWRFGMALLSVVTRETPYSECRSPIELITKLRNYVMPDCLTKVEDPLAVDLISACLTLPRIRESPGQLLVHPYFTPEHSQDSERQHDGDGLIILFKSKQGAGSQELPVVPEGRIPMQGSQAVSGSVPRLLPKEK